MAEKKEEERFSRKANKLLAKVEFAPSAPTLIPTDPIKEAERRETQERRRKKWEIQKLIWSKCLQVENNALLCSVCGGKIFSLQQDATDEKIIAAVQGHSCKLPEIQRIFQRWRDLGSFGALFWKRDGPRSTLILGSRPLRDYAKMAAAGLGLHGRVQLLGSPFKILALTRLLQQNIPNCSADPRTGEVWAPEKIK